MEKIKRFIECLIPVTACNLKCSYCYVIQREKNTGEIPQLKYSPQEIGKALTKERLGGCCYFSICGAGETLIPYDTIEIAKVLLQNGHYVNITTNGTLRKRIEEMLNILTPEEKRRLHFSFSFHYLELKRINKINDFFDTVKMVNKEGCSFVVQLNLCDEYIPYIEEIGRMCKEEIGAYPQIAATRKEKELHNDVQLMTELTKEEYINYGKYFDSPLFDFTMKNFNKKRKEFCFAGEWSFVLNLATGVMKRCYACNKGYDIIRNPHKPIPFCAIGKNCGSLFCMNSSHFMSLGVIPSVETPTYAELRNRKESGFDWYSDSMNEFLSGKLKDQNSTFKNYGKIFLYNAFDKFWGDCSKLYHKLKSIW